MASRKQLYEDAVSRLRNYSSSVSSEEFIQRLLSGNVEATALGEPDSAGNQFAGVLSSITDLLNGGKFTDEIIGEIDGFLQTKKGNDIFNSLEIQRLRQFVRFTLPLRRIDRRESLAFKAGIISGRASFGQRGGESSIPQVFVLLGQYGSRPVGTLDERKRDRNTPDISVIEILHPLVGTKVRDTTGLSIFSSIIPTHIISRAVPYVAVKVYSKDAVQSRNNGVKTANSFNIIRYLRGYAPVVGETEPTLAMLLQGSSTSAGEPRPGGMELFTMPQTLVSNLDDINDSNLFPVRPVDRFRPLLTLNSLTLDIVSAGAGMMSYKNASMNVTLHDRGRLAEIASLVKPGAYSSTEVEIEYGWSIDPGSKNAKLDEVNKKLTGFALQDDVFSQFVDSLKCKEKFGVTNSSFQFDDAGQVTISLSLFTKGAFEARSYDISADSSKDTIQKIKSLLDDINKLISNSPTVANSLSESIRNAASSGDGAVSLDDKSFNELSDAVAKLQKTGGKVGKDIGDLLGNLVTTSGEARRTGAAVAESLIVELMGEDSSEIFPPTAEIAKTKNSRRAWKWNPTRAGKPDFSDGSISLGRLLLRALVAPLSKSKKFDEIQLIFGKINSRAGYVRGLSMAAFPLDKKKLESDIKDLYKKNVQVSSSMLIALIGETHIGSVSYPAYGFTGQYDSEGDLVKGGAEKIDEILSDAGIDDLKFVMPKLQVNFECVPYEKDERQTILRIHVTDESATPYAEYSELVNATRTDGSFLIDSLGLSEKHPGFPDADSAWADLSPGLINESRTKLIDRLSEKGALATAGNGEYKGIDLTKLFTPTNPAEIKKFIAEGLPVIRYGSSAGMLKNLSVTSISDPALATINIIKSDEASGDSPNATLQKGLPMIVTPTEVTMELLGCPLINFGQSVYIDFGTGTTVDNIYACTGVTHTFNPGEFSTSAKFIINVGAYGIYNSDRRAVNQTAAVAAAAAGEPPEPATPASPPSPTPGPIPWESILGASDLSLADIEAFKQRDNTLSGLRLWSSAGLIVSPAEAFSNALTIEAVTSSSPDVNEVLSRSGGDLITCYVMSLPTAGRGIVDAKFYEASDGGTFIITKNVKIDLKNLQD